MSADEIDAKTAAKNAAKKAVGARLRRVRQAPPYWSRPELARLLRAAADPRDRADLPHVESLRQMIKHWENGKYTPWPRYRVLYCRVTGMSEAELFEVPQPLRAGEVANGTDDDDLFASDENVNRRRLLGIMATTAAAGTLDTPLLREAFDAALAAEADGRDADEWERVAFGYAHEVGLAPAALLRPELSADFAELTRLVASAKDGARRRLVHVAAQMAALMAITLTNLGEFRDARRWWRTAARAADQTGDHAAASLVRGRAAVFSLYSPASRLAAVELAEEAITEGRGATCAGVVSGHAARAQGLAELGRHDEAAEALTDLRRAFDRLPDSVRDDRATQWGWSRQRLLYADSYVNTLAGNLTEATQAQDQALQLYPKRNWQGRTQIELHRAGALMRAGDVDEGAAHLIRVLEALPGDRRHDGLLQQTALTSMRLAPPAELGRSRVREARALLTTTTTTGD